MTQAEAKMQRDFRARSRKWFMSCRKCGGDFNHDPRVREWREASGEFAPPKLCSSCVLVKFCMADDGLDEGGE